MSNNSNVTQMNPNTISKNKSKFNKYYQKKKGFFFTSRQFLHINNVIESINQSTIKSDLKNARNGSKIKQYLTKVLTQIEEKQQIQAKNEIRKRLADKYKNFATINQKLSKMQEDLKSVKDDKNLQTQIRKMIENIDKNFQIIPQGQSAKARSSLENIEKQIKNIQTKLNNILTKKKKVSNSKRLLLEYDSLISLAADKGFNQRSLRRKYNSYEAKLNKASADAKAKANAEANAKEGRAAAPTIQRIARGKQARKVDNNMRVKQIQNRVTDSYKGVKNILDQTAQNLKILEDVRKRGTVNGNDINRIMNSVRKQQAAARIQRQFRSIKRRDQLRQTASNALIKSKSGQMVASAIEKVVQNDTRTQMPQASAPASTAASPSATRSEASHQVKNTILKSIIDEGRNYNSKKLEIEKLNEEQALQYYRELNKFSYNSKNNTYRQVKLRNVFMKKYGDELYKKIKPNNKEIRSYVQAYINNSEKPDKKQRTAVQSLKTTLPKLYLGQAKVKRIGKNEKGFFYKKNPEQKKRENST